MLSLIRVIAYFATEIKRNERKRTFPLPQCDICIYVYDVRRLFNSENDCRISLPPKILQEARGKVYYFLFVATRNENEILFNGKARRLEQRAGPTEPTRLNLKSK